ncbi:ribosome alternative rescue factor ArfA [Colwellia sp. D2M02]|uniref:alternative ribosome rescue factor ArfA n=1 Tax=Colwellia sp. D2M02 TaxID=2841562 RepID=UPI001C0A06DB|nr:alternative ribosome rescue factor ArfA [Colwellia sp. D2M02]MBU2894745.1 ribosome alternative rescue factor ArfA [Colwellia sp. D2M02]
MSKRKKQQAKTELTVKAESKSSNDLGRGVIKDSFLKALVTSKVYKMQVVKAKKGKGVYQRKAKNLRRESYLMVA